LNRLDAVAHRAGGRTAQTVQVRWRIHARGHDVAARRTAQRGDCSDIQVDILE